MRTTSDVDPSQPDLHAHLMADHGWDAVELVGPHDHLDSLHRFEHFESDLGLVGVRHRHLAA
jgi:hypothetical protein